MEPGPAPYEHGGRPSQDELTRRRENEFRLLADAMPQFVWTADERGMVTWFNRRWYEYTGLSPERSAGWGWRRAYDPADGDVVEHFRARIRAAETWEETVSLRGREGGYRRFLARAVPLRDEQGRIFRWVGTTTDIEEQLRSREEIERFFQVVPDMLAVAGFEGRLLRVNPAFVRALGWSAEELTSRPFYEFVHPDDVAASRAEMEKLATGAITSHFENRFRTRSGDYRLLSWTGSPRPELRVVYGAARDITEQRRIERERAEAFALLDEQKAALERAAEFRERFLGIVAHDLRNPLATIASAAGLLERLDGVPERGVRLSRSIAATSRRMAKMISDLMDFTRVRLGSGMPIEREPLDLRALVTGVIEDTALAYPGRRLRLEADAEARGSLDGDRMAQAVGNLLKNALDYGPEESAVTVTLEPEGRGVLLRVHNENLGAPIPPDRLSTLFDPFRQAGEGVAKRQGLGLGLYIAREIVRAHGGTIDVSSGAAGTTFSLWLPLA